MAVLSDFPGLSVNVCISGNDVREHKSPDTSQHNVREVYRHMEYEIGSHCSIAIDLNSQLPFRDDEGIVNIEILIGKNILVESCSYFKADLEDGRRIYDEIELQDFHTKYLVFCDAHQITVNVSLGIVREISQPDRNELRTSLFVSPRKN